MNQDPILQNAHESSEFGESSQPIEIEVGDKNPPEASSTPMMGVSEVAVSNSGSSIIEQERLQTQVKSVLKSKEFSQIVFEDDFINPYAETTPQQSEIHNQITQSEIESYNKMIYQWRNTQRQSLAKNMYEHMALKKPISEEKNQIFDKYINEIHHYLRAKFIYEQLLEPIHTEKMLNLNDIKQLEYIYLISFRAWCEINKAKARFISVRVSNELSCIQSSSFKKYGVTLNEEDKNLAYLVEPILKISQKIEYIFYEYQKILTLKENSFICRIKNLTNYLFHYREKTIRDKFLCGFEGIDFTAEEQIQYTSRYTPQIIRNIEQRKITIGPKTISKVTNYKQIVSTFLPRIEGFDDFEIMKNTIISEWKQKQTQPNK